MERKFDKRNQCDKTEKNDKFDRSGKKPRNRRYTGKKGDKPMRNDMAWYSKDKTLIEAVGRIPFGKPIGLGDSDEISDLSVVTNKASLNTEVGVMRIQLLHGPGVATNASSPINVIANNQYAVVRHMNSRTTQYDAPDLMIYYLAVGELYAMYSQIERAYGILNLYTGFNRYLPQALFSAMGFDYNDWVANRAQVLAFAHIMAAQINVFNVPKDLPYYTKLYWAYHSIYADYPLPKAQMYVFAPLGYYAYEPIADTHGGMLKFRVRANSLTFEYFKRQFNTILGALLPDQDIGNMSGDVLKAFGEGNMLRIGELSPDYRTAVTYDEEALWKIHNANFTGEILDGSSNITQNVETNLITWDPTCCVLRDPGAPNPPIKYTKRVLDLPTADPDVKAVIESTRFMFTYRSQAWDMDALADGGWVRKLASSDMLIPVKSTMWSTLENTETRSLTYSVYDTQLYDGINTWFNPEYSSYGADDFSKFICHMSQFRLHPKYDVVYMDYDNIPEVDEPEYVYHGYIWDTHNTAVLGSDELTRMHEACLLSEFGVPLL